jgi:hypothetical protein
LVGVGERSARRGDLLRVRRVQDARRERGGDTEDLTEPACPNVSLLSLAPDPHTSPTHLRGSRGLSSGRAVHLLARGHRDCLALNPRNGRSDGSRGGSRNRLGRLEDQVLRDLGEERVRLGCPRVGSNNTSNSLTYLISECARGGGLHVGRRALHCELRLAELLDRHLFGGAALQGGGRLSRVVTIAGRVRASALARTAC